MEKKTIELYNYELEILSNILNWFTVDALSYNTENGMYEDDLDTIRVNKRDYNTLLEIKNQLDNF